MAMPKDLIPVLAGGAVGFAAGVGGDYLNFKYPQEKTPGVPSPGPADPDYKWYLDRSFMVNAGVAVVGLGMAGFKDKIKIPDQVAIGSAVAGTVALVKALGIVLKVYQQQGTGSKFVNYAYRRGAPTAHQQTRDGPVMGLYNIK